MKRSQVRPSSSSDPATLAPLRAIAFVASLRISNTQTSNLPVLSTCPAIGSPISPQPTNPTFIMIGIPLAMIETQASRTGLGARGSGTPDIGQQRGLRTDDLGERAPGADLVAPDRQVAARAADPDGADELVAVDDDRQSAALVEVAVRILAQLRGAAGQHLVQGPLAGLASIEHGLRLHDRGLDADLALPVHAIE